MAIIRKVRGKSPVYGKGCWFADNAAILGDVTMGDDCNIWFSASVRGDVHYIKMGNKVNIQDGAVLHTTYEKYPLNIGSNVSIAHNAVVHGCTIEDFVLVGMGAVVMDGAVLKKRLSYCRRGNCNTTHRCRKRKYICWQPCKKIKKYFT